MGCKFTLHITKISKKRFHKVIRLNNLNTRLSPKINLLLSIRQRD